MKDPGTTKGEWYACCLDKKPHFVFAGDGEAVVCAISINDPNYAGYEMLMSDVSLLECQHNARLIQDAGNVAQECGLLPSELLKQRDELLEALKRLVYLHMCEQEGIGSGQPTFEQWMKAVEKAEAAINNTQI